MADLPVMLRVRGRRCVVVGGGAVATRRAAALVEAGATVVAVSPQVTDELAHLPVLLRRRDYQQGDLDGALLVVVATGDPAVNQQVAEDAARVGALVNRADDAEQGDLSVPAHAHIGPVTVAVHTGGISAAAAGLIRRQLTAALDPDWPRLLLVVAPFRARVQAVVADAAQRQARLARLADEEALAVLRAGGEEALLRRCEELAAPTASPDPPPLSAPPFAAGATT